MPITNGVIVAPFNTWTMSKFLGMGSVGDVATICAAGEPYVNKWSRKKPVKFNTMLTLTDTQFYESNFGLIINENATPSESQALIYAQTSDWAYDNPVIGDWMRLVDFEGYNHYAEKPYIVEITTEPGLIGYWEPKIKVYAMANNNADIPITDFKAFANSSNIGWGVVYKNSIDGITRYAGWDFNTGVVDYPINTNASFSIDSVIGDVTAAVVIFKPNIGIINIPQAFFNIKLTNFTPEQYIKIAVTPDIDVIYGNKNKVYTSIQLINTRKAEANVNYIYTIKIYSNNVFKTQIQFNGSKIIIDTTRVQYLPIGDIINGNYGIWSDEGGYNNTTYKYELSITTDATGGITIFKQGDINNIHQ